MNDDTVNTTGRWVVVPTVTNATGTTNTITISGSNLPTRAPSYAVKPTEVTGMAGFDVKQRAKYIGAVLAKEQQNHTLACLRVGSWLVEARKVGVQYEDIAREMKAAGVEPISPSRVSVYVGAYEAWVNTGVPDEKLGEFSIDTLYHAGRLIGRTPKKTGEPFTPDEALQFAKVASQADLRKAARKGGLENFPDEPDGTPESDISTVVMPKAAVDTWDAFRFRLSGILGEQVSRTKALEFALMLVNGLSDESLEFGWRAEHGEVTEEEVNPADFDKYEVEADDDQE